MANDASLYPMPAFHFSVSFQDLAETSFQEVSGLSSEVEVETVREGGENRFSHQLPKAVGHGKLVVKRGVFPKASPLYKWCEAVLGGCFTQPITTRQVVVSLMDGENEPCMTWTLSNVYPVKWEIGEFNSTKNEVAVESITFCYNRIKRG